MSVCASVCLSVCLCVSMRMCLGVEVESQPVGRSDRGERERDKHSQPLAAGKPAWDRELSPSQYCLLLSAPLDASSKPSLLDLC